MKPVSEAKGENEPPNYHLRPGVLASNLAHHPATGLGINAVGHLIALKRFSHSSQANRFRLMLASLL
jgi:hypothetical protein